MKPIVPDWTVDPRADLPRMYPSVYARKVTHNRLYRVCINQYGVYAECTYLAISAVACALEIRALLQHACVRPTTVRVYANRFGMGARPTVKFKLRSETCQVVPEELYRVLRAYDVAAITAPAK